MIFSFFYKGKKHKLDVLICDTIISKMNGLMFKKNSKPLLFIFKKETREPIHSFFCMPFVAIWFLDDKIVDIKHVKPWLPSIKPKGKFNKLLEIPKNSKFYYNFPSVDNAPTIERFI